MGLLFVEALSVVQLICEQCDVTGRADDEAHGGGLSASQRHLVHVQKFQMMDNAVQPSQRRPTIVADLQRSDCLVKAKFHYADFPVTSPRLSTIISKNGFL